VRLSQVIACLRRLLKFVVELLLLFPVLVPFARRRPASFTLFPYTTLFRSRSGSSPSAIATAIPPWAHQVEPGSSGTRTVARGRASATVRPATPAPTTSGSSRWTTSALLIPADFEHALDCPPGPDRDVGIYLDLMGHRLQRMANLLESDPLHVRAQIAGADELGVGRLHRHVVGHRALRDHHHPLGLLGSDPVDHPVGRSDVVGFGEDVGRALGMGDDGDPAQAGPMRGDL